MRTLPNRPRDGHEHSPSMLGPFCALCGMSMNADGTAYADGTIIPLPERQPAIIRCPRCGGHGVIDNPQAGQPYPLAMRIARGEKVEPFSGWSTPDGGAPDTSGF